MSCRPRPRRQLALWVWPVLIVVASVASRASAQSQPSPSRWPTESPQSSSQPMSVEITVVGAVSDLQRVRDVVEPLSLGGSIPRWMRVGRLEPMDILGADRDREDVGLRAWIDVTDPKHARLYFAARSGQQFLVRDVELSGTLNEVDRESLSQVVALSITALIENERAGLTRAETQTLLARRQKAAAAARVPPPAAAAIPTTVVEQAPPSVSAPSGFSAGVFYAAQALGTSLPLVHGPGLCLSWGARGERLGLGVWIAGQYQLPASESGRLVGVRFETIGGRGGLQLRWPLPGGARGHLTGRLGIGTDVVRVSPRPGNVDPSATLTASHWSQNWVFNAAVRFGWDVGRRLTVGGSVLADMLPTAVHYDVDVAGARSPVFSPWRMRPGLMLDLGLR